MSINDTSFEVIMKDDEVIKKIDCHYIKKDIKLPTKNAVTNRLFNPLINYKTKSTRTVETNVNDITYEVIFLDITKENAKESQPFSEIEWKEYLKTKKVDKNSSFYERYLLSLKSGISSNLRHSLWTKQTHISTLKSNHKANIYSCLVNNESKFDYFIKKDLERTHLPEGDPNTKKSQLFNVLHAYSLYDNKVGYCQGMNFIALRILNTMQTEEESFWLLVHIMREKDWRSIYLEGTPKLKDLIKELQLKISNSLPILYNHFKNEDLLNMFEGIFSPFYTTLFSYNIDSEFSIRVWDLFFEYNKNIITEVIMCLLRLNEQLLKQMNFDDLYQYFRLNFTNESIRLYGINACLPQLS